MPRSKGTIFLLVAHCWLTSLPAKAQATLGFAHDLLASSSASHLAASGLNSGNRIFELPSQTVALEWRPELKAQITPETRTIIRGRWIFDHRQVELDSPSEKKESTKGSWDLTDAFLESNAMGPVTYSVGLMNYQWGPAELISPTNPIFHFNSQQKSFFYKEKGHVLLKVAANPVDRLSLVFLSEWLSNNERYWIAERDFSPKMLLKAELQFVDPANYAALLVGQEEGSHPFIGEYFSWNLWDGLSVYTDSRLTRGQFHFRPESNAFSGYDLVPASNESDSWQHLSLVGVRYESSDFDLREEYLINSNGWDSTDWNRVRIALTSPSPNISQNYQRFGRSGLELYSRTYSYTSLRFSDLGKKKDANIYLRYLASLVDQSGVFQLDLDKNWNESTVLYFESMVFHGSKETEFRLTEDYRLSFGLKYSL